MRCSGAPGVWAPDPAVTSAMSRNGRSSLLDIGSSSWLLFEEPRSEIVHTPAPRQPLVSRAGRLEIDILDAGLGQLIAEVLRTGAFHGADSQEEDLDPLVERVCFRKHPVVGRLRIERTPDGGAAAE